MVTVSLCVCRLCLQFLSIITSCFILRFLSSRCTRVSCLRPELPVSRLLPVVSLQLRSHLFLKLDLKDRVSDVTTKTPAALQQLWILHCCVSQKIRFHGSLFSCPDVLKSIWIQSGFARKQILGWYSLNIPPSVPDHLPS